jgi:hypothetical protein
MTAAERDALRRSLTAEQIDTLHAALVAIGEPAREACELTTRVLDGLTELLFKASAVWN